MAETVGRDPGRWYVVNVDVIKIDPRELKLLDVNARFMRHETQAQLTANVEKDGTLTSVPFCWWTPDGRWEVLSGNHRVMSAVDAGLEEIFVLVTRDDLTEDERLGIQISHNALTGEDDPATLKLLYEKIGTADLRQYAGLDDKTLALLDEVDLSSLNEANLDYATVQITFLPHELDAAEAALEKAEQIAKYDQRWLAGISQYDATLQALDQARSGANVGNAATALGVILRVFADHLEDLQDYWYDEVSGEANRSHGTVPLESITGTTLIDPQAAGVINRAVRKMIERGDVTEAAPWRALELLAADYLAGS